MTVPSRDLFIVVSEDMPLVRVLTQSLQERADLRVLTQLRAASRADERRVRGLIVDGAQLLERPIGELAAVRARFPLANLLLVANAEHMPLINELQPLRVQILARPLPAAALEAFVERTLSAGRLPSRSMRAWIDEVASECRLTQRDVALMPLILEEETVESTCARLGVDEVSLQRSLRRLIKKCKVRNPDRLAKNLMRGALLFSRQGTAELIDPPRARAASF